MAVSFLYGRLWCGWVCPQTLASDFAESVRTRLDRALRTRPGKPRFALSRALWAGAMVGIALGTGIILTCYWLAPAAVWAATLRPGEDISAALTVYGLTALVAVDLLWVRRRFCAAACPYGPLMSSLTDEKTLAVRFLTERADECITCHKCEVDCPMEIDIKQGVGQHACIGCGECIDSCNDVLGRRGIPGLIEFRYGTEPDTVTKTLPPAKRLGLWDRRRVAVAATVPLCLAVVLFLIFGRMPLTVSVNARGQIVRTKAAVRNGYELTVGNGSPHPAVYTVTVSGLRAQVTPSTLTVAAHDLHTVPIVVSAPVGSVKPGRLRIVLHVAGGQDARDMSTIFYTPEP